MGSNETNPRTEQDAAAATPVQPVMLVAADFTGCAWDVVSYVQDFASKLDHRVVLLNCVTMPLGMDAHTVLHPDGIDVEVEDLLDDDAREHLKPMLASLQGAGIDACLELRHGEPAAAILAAVEAHTAAHVVMGTRGRKGLRRLVEGSVAEKVLRSAPCPVTILRTQSEAAHPGISPALAQALAEGDG